LQALGPRKPFEPETKDLSDRKTYAKICELLLRLKANYLWARDAPVDAGRLILIL